MISQADKFILAEASKRLVNKLIPFTVVPSRMSFGSPTANGRRSLVKYTPLPLFQIAILFILRFCEAASTFVIFPFLNEVTYFKMTSIYLN